MNTLITLGALCGAVFAAGLLLVWVRLPMHRKPGLEARLEPYLRDAAPPSRLLANLKQQKPIAEWLQPIVDDLAHRLDKIMGGAASVTKRQLRAGKEPDLAGFRAEQVTWGAAGAMAGVSLGAFAWMNTGNVALPVLAVIFGAAGGVVLCDQQLSSQVKKREEHMVGEFPTIADLLALSVSAGEGTAAALERICRLSSGELSTELNRCLADARVGASLPVALQGLATRTGLPSLARFVDGIVIALERGTPLAEVLRAQAQDAREERKRQVMEIAGRKEIYMMIPVVFLILPVTILFAVYPGVMYLSLTP